MALVALPLVGSFLLFLLKSSNLKHGFGSSSVLKSAILSARNPQRHRRRSGKSARVQSAAFHMDGHQPPGRNSARGLSHRNTGSVVRRAGVSGTRGRGAESRRVDRKVLFFQDARVLFRLPSRRARHFGRRCDPGRSPEAESALRRNAGRYNRKGTMRLHPRRLRRTADTGGDPHVGRPRHRLQTAGVAERQASQRPEPPVPRPLRGTGGYRAQSGISQRDRLVLAVPRLLRGAVPHRRNRGAPPRAVASGVDVRALQLRYTVPAAGGGRWRRSAYSGRMSGSGMERQRVFPGLPNADRSPEVTAA